MIAASAVQGPQYRGWYFEGARHSATELLPDMKGGESGWYAGSPVEEAAYFADEHLSGSGDAADGGEDPSAGT